MFKPKGTCPFCKEQVAAIVVEENYIRRDICRCPECGESILVCRMPGCSDYAKGGELYDDELCPEHSKIENITGAVTAIGSLATVLLSLKKKD